MSASALLGGQEVLAFAFGVTVFCAFVAGVSVFGLGLMLVPIFLLLYDPKSVVIYSVALGIVISLLVAGQARQAINLRALLPLTIATAVGVLPGVYFLAWVEQQALKLLIGFLIVLFTVPLAFGYRRSFRSERLGATLTGLLGGALSGSTSLCGPVVALFLVNQGWPKETFRATMAAYLVLANSIALVAIYPSGLITREVTVTTLALIPALPIGFYAGLRTLPLISAAIFQKAVIALVFLSGLLIIFISLWGIRPLSISA